MKTNQTLNKLYCFPGFRALTKLKGMFGDFPARIVTLVRRQKKRCAVHAARPLEASTTVRSIKFGTLILEACGCIWNLKFAGSTAGSAMG